MPSQSQDDTQRARRGNGNDSKGQTNVCSGLNAALDSGGNIGHTELQLLHRRGFFTISPSPLASTKEDKLAGQEHSGRQQTQSRTA